MRAKIRRFAALATAVALANIGAVTAEASTDPGNAPERVSISTVSELQVANVFPTWGAQIPKIVYDGHWYYATTLDGNGTEYPWHASIWKSRNGVDWAEAWELVGHVYQPPGLVIDSQNRVFLEVGCYTRAECYPGVAPAPGADMAKVYTVRLLLDERLPDGSIDFSRFEDHSLRSGTTERYYMGMAVDASRRYVYTAYAVGDWGLWFNVFDTVSGTDVSTRQVGTPPAGHAWLYFRIQPGSTPEEIFLSFEQYQLGTPNSAYLDAALLLRSTDGGLTFPETHTLASSPNTDGNLNFVDASDLTLDPEGELHLTFFRRVDGVNTLYYQRDVDGAPAAIGPLDNHSQIVADGTGRITVYGTREGDFAVATSTDGRHWNITTYPNGDFTVTGPNLLRPLSGSLTPPTLRGAHPGHQMLLAGRRAGSSSYTLLLATHH
jgi:hypothetical protein